MGKFVENRTEDKAVNLVEVAPISARLALSPDVLFPADPEDVFVAGDVDLCVVKVRQCWRPDDCSVVSENITNSEGAKHST